MAALSIRLCFLLSSSTLLSPLTAFLLLVSHPWMAMAADEPSLSPVCRTLSKALPGRVFFPATNGYLSSLKSYFSLQESEITPCCVVSPLSSQDVSTAITILGAPNSSTPFAIRGGGHTPWAGSANIENGVTIDMRRINKVAISGDKTMTSVGAGALWRDVYINSIRWVWQLRAGG